MLPRSRVSAGCLLSVSDWYRETNFVSTGLANFRVLGNTSLIGLWKSCRQPGQSPRCQKGVLMTKGEKGDLKPFAKQPAIRWRDAGDGRLTSKWLPAVRAMDHPTVRSRRREESGRR